MYWRNLKSETKDFHTPELSSHCCRIHLDPDHVSTTDATKGHLLLVLQSTNWEVGPFYHELACSLSLPKLPPWLGPLGLSNAVPPIKEKPKYNALALFSMFPQDYHQSNINKNTDIILLVLPRYNISRVYCLYKPEGDYSLLWSRLQHWPERYSRM